MRSIKLLWGTLFALLSACSGDDQQLPPSTTIAINPSVVTWDAEPNEDDAGNCTINPDFYIDEIISIRVINGSSSPLGEVEIIVSLSLSANSGTAGTFFDSDTQRVRGVVELFDDLDGDYIPDDEELVSDVADPVLVTQTSEYTGEKVLLVRMNLSCEYRAVLHVTAQGFSSSIELEVE